ncbi:MAG: protein kinase [Candidatus Obscuribacterales bacterium]|nr:protein kinase [Candidatus Obscuribacterales bacterium]
MSTSPADRLIGTVLDGRYELLSVIGKGQGGVIYRATHRQLERPLTVKMQLSQSVDDEQTFLRFQREARSASRLNHPNIITVFDFGLTPERYPYLVMDFVEGRDLHMVLEKEGALTLARSIRICAQICSALGHAHKRGVIHRDLKPRNVMLMDAEDLIEFVKVVDFGIAKQLDERGESLEQVTLEGYVLGTPAYMSPEQWQGKALDARADIYSMGCLLFKMLTGMTPIPGTDMLQMMNGHVTGKPMSFEDASPTSMIPQAVQDVIYKALSKDLNKRQSSMANFRAELQSAFTGHTDQGKKWMITPLEASAATSVPEDVTSTDLLRERALGGDVKAQYELSVRLDGLSDSNPAEIASWLKLAARAGLKEAQYRLGEYLMKGHPSIVSNPVEAMAWFRRAAEQGMAQAQFALANCFELGYNGQESLPDAINWYQRAKTGGVSGAEQKLSQCYKKLATGGQTITGMLSSLQAAAQTGDPDALYALAVYMRTRNQEPDKVVQALQDASGQGHLKAQLLLSELLLKGEGAVRNPVEAIRHLQQATTQHNNSDAMLMLAACARAGVGGPRDVNAAFGLVQRAITANNPNALCVMGCSLMTGDGIPRNIPHGIGLLKKASAENSALAHWKLALCFKQGLGVPKDSREMERLFSLAAEARFPQGVDWMWSNETFAFSSAMQAFTSLANIGNRNAMYWLGICAESGLGAPRSLSKAIEFHTSAADRGHPGAQQELNRLRGNTPATA